MPTHSSLAAASGITGANVTSLSRKSACMAAKRASSGSAPKASASRRPRGLPARRSDASTMPSPTTTPNPGRPFLSKLKSLMKTSRGLVGAARGGLNAQLLDGGCEGQARLILRSQATQCDRAFCDLAFACREDHGNLREAVLAHFVIDLLVAQVRFGPDAGA